MEYGQGLTGTLFTVLQSSGVSAADIRKALSDYFEENSIIAPTINVAEIDGGYKITISDADGLKEYELNTGNSTEVLNLIREVEGKIPTMVSELSEDASHRTVSDEEKIKWNKGITDADFERVTTSDESSGKSTEGFRVGTFTSENPSVAWVQAIADELNRSIQSGATKSYVDSKIGDLVGNAPSTLDTIHEIADALGQDKNFSTTILEKLNNKVDKVFGKGLSTNDLTNSLLNKINDSASREWVGNQGFAKGTDLNDYTRSDEMSRVATTGDYNDLSNLPNLRKYDESISGLESVLLQIKSILDEGELTQLTCERISNLIVSYFENKTVSGVES